MRTEHAWDVAGDAVLEMRLAQACTCGRRSPSMAHICNNLHIKTMRPLICPTRCMSIRGNRWYLLVMLYSETRYWVAEQVAEREGGDDVRLMFRTAKEVAGKIPTAFISDQASNFHHAWKREYQAKNFLRKDAKHISEAAFGGRWHNQQRKVSAAARSASGRCYLRPKVGRLGNPDRPAPLPRLCPAAPWADRRPGPRRGGRDGHQGPERDPRPDSGRCKAGA